MGNHRCPRGLILLPVIVLPLLWGSLACGEEEAGLQEPSATPAFPAVVEGTPSGPGATLWRWVNVTLLVPDDGRFYVVQDSDPPEARPPSGGPVLKLYKVSAGDPSGMPSAWVHIDAETGAVIREQMVEADGGGIQTILGTLNVSPLDVSTAGWPYNAELTADNRRETYGGMSYIRPTPDTGLLIRSNISDPGGPGIGIVNGRSGVGVYIDEATGELRVNTEYLVPEYEAVFMRWVDSVKLCGSEIPC